MVSGALAAGIRRDRHSSPQDAGPHPAGEQPLEGMHIVIGDAQAVAAEVDALGHIGVADQAHLDFVDEGVAATGTLAPTFTARIRSLRTHLPAKT